MTVTNEIRNECPPRLWLDPDDGTVFHERFNDDDRVEYVRTDLIDVRQLYTLTEIREAIGDPHGRLMLDEVVERVRELAEQAGRAETCAGHLAYSQRCRQEIEASLGQQRKRIAELEERLAIQGRIVGHLEESRDELADVVDNVIRIATTEGSKRPSESMEYLKSVARKSLARRDLRVAAGTLEEMLRDLQAENESCLEGEGLPIARHVPFVRLGDKANRLRREAEENEK